MPEKILVVDEDERFRVLVVRTLESKGYSVTQASTGSDATSIAKSLVPDLVIVDYRLPDCDGLSWITRLRESGCEVPVILLSGVTLESKVLNILFDTFGVSATLHKPINFTELTSLIADHLKQYSILSVQSKAFVEPTEQSADSEVTESCSAKLNDVIEEYCLELPSRLASLGCLIPRAAMGSREALHTIITEAHKLRGTAAAFGFPALGDAMADIEDVLVWVSVDQAAFRDSCAWMKVDKALWTARSAVFTQKETTNAY